MATLYLFVGYPGSGKTTVAQIICAATGATHIWADHERKHMFGTPSHTPEESKQLYTELNARTKQLLATGKSVVFDTNFNFYKDREHMREIARATGADVTLIWVRTDRELAKHRAVNDSHDKPTRLYGNMSEPTFERIAGHLEAPKSEEHPIEFVGDKLQKSDVLHALKLL